MIIEDGKGRGNSVSINAENQLSVKSMTETFYEHRSLDGYAFSSIFSVTPSGANTCFYYLKNTYSEELVINKLRFIVPTTGERIQLKVGDIGTPAGGNDIIPVNFNTGSGIKANVVAQSGNSITGLSGGLVVGDLTVSAAGDTKTFDLGYMIVLSPGTVFTLYAVAGSLAIRGSIPFTFHDKEYV